LPGAVDANLYVYYFLLFEFGFLLFPARFGEEIGPLSRSLLSVFIVEKLINPIDQNQSALNG
jgi:hypothetical protein